MKKVFTKEVLIAIAVIVSIGLLYWGINYLKGVNLFTPANYYTVSFEKVNGLKVSAPVTINGFQAGLVSDVSYDYNDGNIDVAIKSAIKEYEQYDDISDFTYSDISIVEDEFEKWEDYEYLTSDDIASLIRDVNLSKLALGSFNILKQMQIKHITQLNH